MENQKQQLSSEDVRLILARYYRSERMRSQGNWDIDNGKVKYTALPSSFAVLKILNVDDWEEVKLISKQEYHKWAKEIGSPSSQDVKKVLHERIQKLLTHYQLLPHYQLLDGTIREYDKARLELKEKDIELTSSANLIKTFGSWNAVKQEFGLKERTIGAPEKYTKDELLKYLKKYGEHLHTGNWNDYVKEYGIPSIDTFFSYFTKDEIARYTQYRAKSFSHDDMVKIAWKHRKEFSKSIRAWGKYAGEHKLPAVRAYENAWTREKYKEARNYLKQSDATLSGLKSIFQA